MTNIRALVLQGLNLYAWSLIFCEFTFKFLRKKFKVWFALEVILLICLSHLRFANAKPKGHQMDFFT